MNQYAQEAKNIFPPLDNEAAYPTSPLPREQEIIHVYPTSDGGVLFSKTELEPQPAKDDVPFFLFPACFLVLLGMIFLSLFIPTPTHEIAFTLSVHTFSLPTVTKAEKVEYDEKTGITNHTVKFVVSLSTPAQQEAVKQYRRRLSPIFFAIAQKVYAELFRVFLGQNGFSADDTQYKLQKRIKEVIANRTIASMTFLPIFLDRADFDNWWQGEYVYEDLRFARNEVMHNHYEMTSSNHLQVTHNARVVLDWDNDTILLFSQKVLAKAQVVCTPVKP